MPSLDSTMMSFSMAGPAGAALAPAGASSVVSSATASVRRIIDFISAP
ncbi:MAG: hypothetical protein ACR2H7_01520 [Actinomycetota bacterium]